MDDCAGCTYWDGDDGRCRNGSSPEFMRETQDGCEKHELMGDALELLKAQDRVKVVRCADGMEG